MEQQMRFNAGKAKLSIIYASARAFAKIDEQVRNETFIPEEDCLPTEYEMAVGEIADFLDGQNQKLAAAAISVLSALENELSDGEGSCLDGFGGAAEFFAECPYAMDALCDLYEYGATKYARGNFRKGAPVTQYLDSAMRHLNARLRGETVDPESGLRHGTHAFWNLFQALDQPDYRDDRLPGLTLVPVPEEKPAPVEFDLDEAQRRVESGRTVKVRTTPEGRSNVLLGAEVRKTETGFEYKCEPLHGWSWSSFPYGYDGYTFAEEAR